MAISIKGGMLIIAYHCLYRIDPFRGSYNVAVSVYQFYTIREAIRSMIQMDQEDDDNNTTNGDSKKRSESDIINSFEPPGDGTLWL